MGNIPNEDIPATPEYEKIIEEILEPDERDSESIRLLKRWFHWWWNDLDAPAKPSGGIHVRTYILLADLYARRKE